MAQWKMSWARALAALAPLPVYQQRERSRRLLREWFAGLAVVGPKMADDEHRHHSEREGKYPRGVVGNFCRLQTERFAENDHRQHAQNIAEQRKREGHQND